MNYILQRIAASGVGFYDPQGEGETIMRLYKIKKSQFNEIQTQEGGWYSRKILLDVVDDCPVYTFTSETRFAESRVDVAYLNLLNDTLAFELKIPEEEIIDYLKL